MTGPLKELSLLFQVELIQYLSRALTILYINSVSLSQLTNTQELLTDLKLLYSTYLQNQIGVF